MAKDELADEQKNNAQVERLVCGLIMPISATANYTEKHWESVNLLMHRCINAASFSPLNVWEKSSTDRVSERIIGNIFNAALVIADITDLNPNVMLELGLRLSSKKPTIVVAADGSTIPFDLRDFHAIFYPKDLNILEMESFFINLTKALKEKITAFSSDKYVPFLGNIIVDVISPQRREIGPDELVLSRLDDLNSTVERLQSLLRNPNLNHLGMTRPIKFTKDSGYISVNVPVEAYSSLADKLLAMFEVDDVDEIGRRGDDIRARVTYSGCADPDGFSEAFNEVLRFHGGRSVPRQLDRSA